MEKKAREWVGMLDVGWRESGGARNLEPVSNFSYAVLRPLRLCGEILTFIA
jgi:hypothetical protein